MDRQPFATEERPPSEQMVDLHVYVVPCTMWKDHLKSAENGIIPETVSAGFIRVLPDTRICDLREEIESQLGEDGGVIPPDYVFLKSVGSRLTRVKPKQEVLLKVKAFLYPLTEIFIMENLGEFNHMSMAPLSGGSSMRTFSAALRYSTDTYKSDKSEFSPHKTIPPINDRGVHSTTMSTQTGENSVYPTRASSTEHNPADPDEDTAKADECLPPLSASPPPSVGNSPTHRREIKYPPNTSADSGIEEAGQSQNSGKNGEETKTGNEEEMKEINLESLDDLDEADAKEYDEQALDDDQLEENSESLDQLQKDHKREKDERKSMEKKREEMMRRAKMLQQKTQTRRNQARDRWKKLYFDEKKLTTPLEDKADRLRVELELIHKRLMSQLETHQERDTAAVRKLNNKPSQQNNLKIQATKLHHDIGELQRRSENVKMKLTAEMKLRSQAQNELKALRAEARQKKLAMSISRSLQPSAMGTDRRSPRINYTAATPLQLSVEN